MTRARAARSTRLVVALCLAIFAIRSYASLRQESTTFDETNYFGIGKYLADTGRWDVPGSILHPPFFYYLSSLPFWFIETDPGVWRSDPGRSADLEYLASGDIPRGQALLSSRANDDDVLLTWCRLTTVATALLLGWYVYVWSAQLYGSACGILAVVLFTCCPNILAHARLITPDVSVTTFSFITVYYAWRTLHTGTLRPAIVGGVYFGLALLSKFTALLLLPILLGLVILWRLLLRETYWTGCAVLVACGLTLLVAGYGGNVAPFWGGLEIQHRLASTGHASFLFGETSITGWWYYLVVAFLVKTPLGLFVILALALWSSIGRSRPASHWVDLAFLLVPVAAVVGFFSVDHQAIGLRYMLPAFPFLFVFASQALRPRVLRAWRNGAVVVAVGWYVAASVWIHPHYLAYFNELVGGPRNGHKVLVDSNLDWGQGLKQLKAFMTAHGISKVALGYFGTDAPERFGIDYVALPSVMLLNPAAARERPDPNGWFAISATNLQGVYFEGRDPYAVFRKLTPQATLGYSIFLYRAGAAASPASDGDSSAIWSQESVLEWASLRPGAQRRTMRRGHAATRPLSSPGRQLPDESEM